MTGSLFSPINQRKTILFFIILTEIENEVKILNLSNRIRRLRKLKGFSQVEACRGIVSISHYSNIENGRYMASEDTLSLLANRFSVPNSYLLKTAQSSKGTRELIEIYEKMIERGENEEARKYLDSYKKKLEYIDSLMDEFSFRMTHFIFLIQTNQIEASSDYYEKHIESYENVPDLLNSKLQQKYYYVTGLYHYTKGNYTCSIHYSKKSILTEENNSHKARISYNIALCYFNLYQFDQALLYVKKAGTLYLELHNWDKTGDSYNLISLLLREMKLWTKAEEYIGKGFDIAGKNAIELQSKLHHNLALIKYDQGIYEEALESVNEAIRLKEKAGNLDLFISHHTKMNILLEAKDILELKKELKTARKYISDPVSEAHFLFVEASMHYLLEDYPLYESIMPRCIQTYLEFKRWPNLEIAAEHFSLYLEKQHKYKKALYFHKLCLTALKNLRGENEYEKN